ncbi:MAG: hypothetical protein WCQ95_13390 [Bacteroidota bacterium]
MIAEQKVTHRPLAVILTLAFHGLLILFLVLMIFHTPKPPYPMVGGGSGLEVNFGNSDNGMGNNNSDQLIPISTQDLSQNNNDNIITQDNEEAIALNSNDNPKKTNTEIVKINDPVINPNALYKKKTGDGITAKAGNQGKPNGDLNSKSYTGDGGSGGGTGGGHGTGIGPNDGLGVGPGHDKGISFVMKDRSIKYLPKPINNTKAEGIVVVEIWVDKKGNVTKYIAGAKGSTTTNQNLWKIAGDAAKRATFSVKADAPEEQKGTISYNFVNLN